jgi:predicted phage terminase large subunit-like protein
VEKAGVGAALLQERQSTRAPFIGIMPSADKETRLRVQAAKFEGRQVHLPARASWLADLEAELFSFPNGRHDDQVDSISQFLEWASLPRAVPRIRRL